MHNKQDDTGQVNSWNHATNKAIQNFYVISVFAIA